MVPIILYVLLPLNNVNIQPKKKKSIISKINVYAPFSSSVLSPECLLNINNMFNSSIFKILNKSNINNLIIKYRFFYKYLV